MSSADSKDHNGREVRVGTRVRIIALSESLLSSLPEDEVDDVRSMIGEVFEVTEIGPYGHAWVGKGWMNDEGDKYCGHSLALASEEMEVVDERAL